MFGVSLVSIAHLVYRFEPTTREVGPAERQLRQNFEQRQLSPTWGGTVDGMVEKQIRVDCIFQSRRALAYKIVKRRGPMLAYNDDAFLFHDKTGQSQPVEREIGLDEFPSAEELWRLYSVWKGLTPAQEAVVAQPYFPQAPDKAPRYYQEIAINRAIEAIAKGENRILLTMATGTGKTFVAFQIIWRLWKAGSRRASSF